MCVHMCAYRVGNLILRMVGRWMRGTGQYSLLQRMLSRQQKRFGISTMCIHTQHMIRRFSVIAIGSEFVLEYMYT